jgi:hypothetical protein
MVRGYFILYPIIAKVFLSFFRGKAQADPRVQADSRG